MPLNRPLICCISYVVQAVLAYFLWTFLSSSEQEKKMALYCDSAKALLEEIARHVHSYEEYFALIGLQYCTRKILVNGWAVLGAIRVHVFSRLRDNTTYVRQFGKWAVVTGSTDGIGKAYARELAKRGLNIILVSRNLEKLNQVASEIENEFQVQTHVIQADFSFGHPIYSKINSELKDKEIGILVNNVGVLPSYPKSIMELEEDTIWQHINVNIAAVTLMTKMVIPQMTQRQKGAIINISSGSAFTPIDYFSVYGATKAYNNYFSQVIRSELEDSGIVVQLVCPFYVATNMTKYSPAIQKNFFTLDVTSFVKHAIGTLGYTSYTTGHWLHGLQYIAFEMCPLWMSMWLYSKIHALARSQGKKGIGSDTKDAKLLHCM